MSYFFDFVASADGNAAFDGVRWTEVAPGCSASHSCVAVVSSEKAVVFVMARQRSGDEAVGRCHRNNSIDRTHVCATDTAIGHRRCVPQPLSAAGRIAPAAARACAHNKIVVTAADRQLARHRLGAVPFYAAKPSRDNLAARLPPPPFLFPGPPPPSTNS